MKRLAFLLGFSCLVGCSKPPPKITEVKPKTLCQSGGTLDVLGMDFQDGAEVSVGTIVASSSVLKSPGELVSTVGGTGAQFTPGTKYDLTVKNPDGAQDTLAGALTAVTDPVLFFVDPPVVYNGVATPLALRMTALSPPVQTVTITNVGTGTNTVLSGAQQDPAHPSVILVNAPKDTPAGDYDITVQDASSCVTRLPKALKVVDKTTLMLTSITPGFGWKDATTAVSLTAQGGLSPTPAVYLNPSSGGANAIATPLASVAFISASKLTAIVPKGLDPAGSPYDVIVVNPDGSVGLLPKAYRSTALAPPVIDAISPGAVPSTAAPAVTITGQNFRTPAVTFSCLTDVTTGTSMNFPATASGVTGTSITISSPPVTSLTTPSLCSIRVTNGDDQTFADFSALAISNGSGNLSAPKADTPLSDARRAPAVVASAATRAARFLYVIGGDSGMPSGALDSVLTASVDEKGTGPAWTTQRYRLNAKRTLSSAASLGRYLYVAGGNDGTSPVKTVERAMVLDPLQAPTISDLDVTPGSGTGLGGGTWYYRVAAVMATDDADNPGGETLPSDVVTLRVPELSQRIQIKLTWTAVPGAAGYVIYRTPANGKISGDEEYLDTVTGGSTLTYTDAGKATDATKPKPLQQGATGKWRMLPPMTTNRESLGLTFGTDPASASTVYLYATLGRDAAALSSYEFLTVTVAPSGSQTFASAWTAGAMAASSARYQHSVYSASSGIASFIPAGSNYIYLGGGTTNGTMAVQVLEVAKVSAGGQLGAFAASGTTIKTFGHGGIIAANYLYSFGDEMPTTGIRAGQISQGAVPSVSNFNNNGTGMLTARYLPGTALSGARIYVVGGSASGKNSASTSVESLIW